MWNCEPEQCEENETGESVFGIGDPGYLDGAVCRLRHVEAHDHAFIRAMETSRENFIRYRHRGVSKSPEAYAQSLWQSVLCQFIVESISTGKPLGVVVAYGADFRNSRSHLAVISKQDIEHRVPMLEAMRIFVDYLFAVFPLKKLTAEVISFNWPRVFHQKRQDVRGRGHPQRPRIP